MTISVYDWLLGYRTEFSCLYLSQGHAFISICVYEVQMYMKCFDFERKSIFIWSDALLTVICSWYVKFRSIVDYPCTTSPCGAHGTCYNGDTSYHCVCKDGFKGTNCQQIGLHIYLVWLFTFLIQLKGSNAGQFNFVLYTHVLCWPHGLFPCKFHIHGSICYFVYCRFYDIS